MNNQQYIKWAVELSEEEYAGKISELMSEIEKLEQQTNELWRI